MSNDVTAYTQHKRYRTVNAKPPTFVTWIVSDNVNIPHKNLYSTRMLLTIQCRLFMCICNQGWSVYTVKIDSTVPVSCPLVASVCQQTWDHIGWLLYKSCRAQSGLQWLWLLAWCCWEATDLSVYMGGSWCCCHGELAPSKLALPHSEQQI